MTKSQPKSMKKANAIVSPEIIDDLNTVLKKILNAWSLIPLQDIDSIGKLHNEVAQICAKNYDKDNEFSRFLRYLAKIPFHVAKGLHCNLINKLESSFDNYKEAENFCNVALEGFKKDKDTTYKEFISIFPIIDFLECCHSITSILKEDASNTLESKKNQVEKFRNLAGWFRKMHTTLVRTNNKKFNEYLDSISTLDKRIVDLYRANAHEIDEQIKFMKPTSNKVFIVHGHNYAILDELKEFLEDSCDIKPVVLYRAPDEGRTIIEKYEDDAISSGFVFVIMTRDDLVQKEDESYKYDIVQKELYYQGRPNVFFELGWFCGRYGRGRVRILKQKGAYVPSDLSGIITINFNKQLKEVSKEIKKELKHSGFIIPEEKNKSEENQSK